MVTLLVLFVLLAPGMAPALKTNQVEFGKDGAYDGHVIISRDVSGNMVFKDDFLTSPIALATIAHGVRDHGELTGLGSDDHTQYLNTGRHGAVHTAAFNNNLPIGPDVINNTTIGQHVQDGDIHISRSLGEMIVGPWKFDVLQEFRGNIKLSQHGLPGKMDIYFEDGESDAYLRWNKLYNRFEFNRMLYTPEANFDSATATTLRIGENLYGNRPNYPPSGRISNFVSIEGIASENLLDKSADEDISGKWDFLNDVYIDGDLVTSGTITSLGGIKGLSKENVITVAKKGGDYETVQEAVNAASAGTTILVYPGTYTEQIVLDKNYISIIGITPNGSNAVVSHNTGVIITYTAPSGTSNVMRIYDANHDGDAPKGIVLANLTIINGAPLGQGGAQTALNIGETGEPSEHPEVYVSNCSFYGNQDTVWVNASGNNGYVTFRNCYIYGTLDVFSAAKECKLFDCFIENGSATATNSCIWIGNLYALRPIYMKNCTFKSNSVPTGTGGLLSFGGTYNAIYLLDCTYLSASDTYSAVNPGGHNGTIYLQNTNGLFFGTGVTVTPYLSQVGNYNSLQIAGTERIDSSGNIKGATLLSGGNIVADASGGLASYTTLWKDFAACQGQNANSADMESHTHNSVSGSTDDPGNHYHNFPNGVGFDNGTSTYYTATDAGAHTHTVSGAAAASTNGNSWHPAAGNDVTYMHCTADAKCRLFDIPYLSGTILTRLRVEWQADGNNSGVKVRLLKRQLKASSWTLIGSQQTYTDSAPPYDITVCSGSPEYYDFPDETMTAGYVYAIEVESEVVTAGTKLYSVGVETSKRVY